MPTNALRRSPLHSDHRFHNSTTSWATTQLHPPPTSAPSCNGHCESSLVISSIQQDLLPCSSSTWTAFPIFTPPQVQILTLHSHTLVPVGHPSPPKHPHLGCTRRKFLATAHHPSRPPNAKLVVNLGGGRKPAKEIFDSPPLPRRLNRCSSVTVPRHSPSVESSTTSTKNQNDCSQGMARLMRSRFLPMRTTRSPEEN